MTVVATGPLVQLQRPTIATDQKRRNSARTVTLTIDGQSVTVREGTTVLEACRSIGIEIPTLCFLETLHPVNACRICVVEMEGARVLVPSCSRARGARGDARRGHPGTSCRARRSLCGDRRRTGEGGQRSVRARPRLQSR